MLCLITIADRDDEVVIHSRRMYHGQKYRKGNYGELVDKMGRRLKKKPRSLKGCRTHKPHKHHPYYERQEKRKRGCSKKRRECKMKNMLKRRK